MDAFGNGSIAALRLLRDGECNSLSLSSRIRSGRRRAHATLAWPRTRRLLPRTAGRRCFGTDGRTDPDTASTAWRETLRAGGHDASLAGRRSAPWNTDT